MTSNEHILSLLLGMGGEQPGVGELLPKQADVVRLLELPSGHSVYAIDADTTGTKIAVGSRAGAIYVLQGDRSVCLEQGAPVLAVCLLDDLRVASTDTQGRCLLWQPSGDIQHPRSLTTEGDCICSLLELHEDHLLGVSSSGRILAWDIHDEQLVRSIDCPVPSAKWALVRLLHWPDTDIVVYPAIGGQIALGTLDERGIRAWNAHDRDFCATFFAGNVLCTVGMNDGLMRAWDANGTLLKEYSVPKGVIAGEEVSEDGHVLLITEDGLAGIYEPQANALRLKSSLAGADYRVVRGPSPDLRKRVLQEQRMARGQELRRQIQEKTDAGETEGIAGLHQQLVDLGYSALSLALQAQQADRQGNAVSGLRARHALAQTLPSGEPKAATSLFRYARSLEATWLLPDASAVLDGIKAFDEAFAPSEWLKKTSEAMQAEQWVVDADLPASDLIEAAEVIGKPFIGRWVLERFSHIPFPEGRLLATDLVQKYEQVRREDGRTGFPAAQLDLMCWLSRNTPVTIETVLLTGPPNPMTVGAELAIQILHDGLQTILAPYLLLNAWPKEAANGPSEHNRWVAEALAGISHRDRISPWLDALRRLLTRALQRLRTEQTRSRSSD